LYACRGYGYEINHGDADNRRSGSCSPPHMAGNRSLQYYIQRMSKPYYYTITFDTQVWNKFKSEEKGKYWLDRWNKIKNDKKKEEAYKIIMNMLNQMNTIKSLTYENSGLEWLQVDNTGEMGADT